MQLRKRAEAVPGGQVEWTGRLWRLWLPEGMGSSPLLWLIGLFSV